MNIRYVKQIKDENKAWLECHDAINSHGRSKKSDHPDRRPMVPLSRLQMLPLTDPNFIPHHECPLPESYRTTNPQAAARYFARRDTYQVEVERSKQVAREVLERDESIQRQQKGN